MRLRMFLIFGIIGLCASVFIVDHLLLRYYAPKFTLEPEQQIIYSKKELIKIRERYQDRIEHNEDFGDVTLHPETLNIVDANTGKALLSWRVAILPMLDEQKLYECFKLDEPWNSNHNLAPIKMVPRIYLSPLSDNPQENGKSNCILKRIEGDQDKLFDVVITDDTLTETWTEPRLLLDTGPAIPPSPSPEQPIP